MKKSYIPNIESIQNRLFDEICSCMQIDIHLSKIFKKEQLFLSDKFLNNEKEAKLFFYDLYIMLNESLILKVVRLFDPKDSRGNKNFSFDRILALVPDSEKKRTLSIMKDALSKKITSLTAYRCKTLAHLDLEETLKNNFPDFSQHRKNALDCLECLKTLYEALLPTDSELSWEPINFDMAPIGLIHFFSLGTYVWQNRHREDCGQIIAEMNGIARSKQ